MINLKKHLIKRLDILKGHGDSERFARELYKTQTAKIFDLKNGKQKIGNRKTDNRQPKNRQPTTEKPTTDTHKGR